MKNLLVLTVALAEAANFEALKSAVAEKPNEAAADLVTLFSENAELNEAFSALKKDHEALAKVNAELTEQLEALPAPQPAIAVEEQKPKVSDKTFTHKNIEYGFVYPQLRLAGAIITADDVLNSTDLKKNLVEMKSGFIHPVKK